MYYTLIPQHYYKYNFLSTSKYVSNPTDMTKVAIKSEKLSPFGGFFFNNGAI